MNFNKMIILQALNLQRSNWYQMLRESFVHFSFLFDVHYCFVTME